MIKIYLPTDKNKFKKTAIRGYWRGDSGLCYDNLKVIDWTLSTADLYGQNRLTDYLEVLRTGYRQEAIFYVKDNKGYCFYNRDKIEVLSDRIYAEVKNLRAEIKEALKLYGGVTIYKVDNKYFKEVFYNKAGAK